MYPVSAVPTSPSCFHAHTSRGGSAESGSVDDGRSSTPPLVWKALYPQMLGRATIARTRASISGSRQRVVAGPAHAGAPPGREVAVEVERPRAARGVGIVNPSWSTIVPSSSSR